jgi:hypothetical protein
MFRAPVVVQLPGEHVVDAGETLLEVAFVKLEVGTFHFRQSFQFFNELIEKVCSRNYLQQ